MDAELLEEFKDTVRKDLRAGFGVEDIAVMNEYPISAIRLYVSQLEKSGWLKKMYKETRFHLVNKYHAQQYHRLNRD